MPKVLHLNRYFDDIIRRHDRRPAAGHVSQALVAISPIVPQTSLETQYSLEVNLIDADGALMAANRAICTVTTTHALNFRDVAERG